jgi:hypothetical protein
VTYKVTSSRLAWRKGTILTVTDLAGCNIAALEQGGHLAPVIERKRKVVQDTADQPEEQD